MCHLEQQFDNPDWKIGDNSDVSYEGLFKSVFRLARHEQLWIFLANFDLSLFELKDGASKGCVELLWKFSMPAL